MNTNFRIESIEVAKDNEIERLKSELQKARQDANRAASIAWDKLLQEQDEIQQRCTCHVCKRFNARQKNE